MEDGLDDQEAEIASSNGGFAPGSVVAMLRFQATLRSDTSRRVYLPLPGEPEVRHLAGTVDGMRYRCAVESIDGSPALVLGPAWRRGCGLKAGDRVRVELEPEGPERPDLLAFLSSWAGDHRQRPGLRVGTPCVIGRRRSSEEETRCRKKSRETQGESRQSHRRTTPTSTIGSDARCHICNPLSRHWMN